MVVIFVFCHFTPYLALLCVAASCMCSMPVLLVVEHG